MMTDREALVILAAGFADTQYTAANAVDEAIEALKLIDAHLAGGDAPDAEMSPLPEWVVVSHGYLRDVRRDGDGAVIAWFEKGRWNYWARPDSRPEDRITVETYDHMIIGVDWGAWAVVP